MTRLGKMTGGIPASALPPAGPVARTKMAERLDNIVRGEEVALPVIGRAYIQLASHTISNEIEAATWAEMKRLELPAQPLFIRSFKIEHDARVLARCVRDPDDHDQPFGSLEEWRARLDDDLILACGLVYADVRERLDPIGFKTALTDEESEEIAQAFKKKDPVLLTDFGVATLSRWLLSGAVQLSSSPTPASSTGEPSAEP